MKANEAVAIARVRRMFASGEARRRREAAGLRQAETGSTAGVTAATVSRWESGQRVPGSEHALTYASLLDLLEANEEGSA